MPEAEPRIRIVATPDDDGKPTLTIYLNEAGQLLLLRTLARLHSADRHTHLDRILTTAGESDIGDADVVLVEGRGDIAHAPPNFARPS